MKEPENNSPYRRPTLADVARETGLSRSTISLVLNNAPLSKNLAAQTKMRVVEVAQRLNYRPDAFARSLRKRQSIAIGIMVFNLSDPYCTRIVEGIEEKITLGGYLPLMMDAHNKRLHFERYLSLLLEHRIEALIVIANWLYIDIAMIKNLNRHGIPVGVIGVEMQEESIASFLVDNELGGELALEHLYSLGHRKIAFVRGPKGLFDSSRRWKGMRRFAKKHNLELCKEWIVDLPRSTDPNSGFFEGKAQLVRMLAKHPGFTAVVAFDDLTAFGIVGALCSAGLSVPGDCSVIGFDDVPYSEMFNPGLTTIRQPMIEMGKVAAEWILEAVKDPTRLRTGKAHIMRLEPSVVIRNSTDVPPKSPTLISRAEARALLRRPDR